MFILYEIIARLNNSLKITLINLENLESKITLTINNNKTQTGNEYLYFTRDNTDHAALNDINM